MKNQKPKTTYQKPAAICWLLLLLTGTLTARAQIVDDSTKIIYGPRTTRVIYEAEVARDSVGGTRLDTVLTRFAQARFWLHDSTFQQDIGILGAASRPLLYQPNLQLGARLGRTVFDRNTRASSQVPYYDSRSPFSFFRLVQSSSGEQVFEISYSRSLKKNFSVGVDYERIAANQVLAAGAITPQVEHNNFTLFGRFQTEDGRYHVLANYSASRQSTREQGGINFTSPQIRALRAGSSDSLFNYANERVFLAQARNIDDRDELRVFQSYRLARRGFTAYHVLDLRRQYNGYTDDALPRDAGTGTLQFYPIQGLNRGTYRNPLATNDRASYRQVENTIGLLGRTDRVEYNLYARQRGASLALQTTRLGLSGPGARLVSVGPASVRDGQLAPVVADSAAGALRFGQLFVGGTAAFNYREIYAVEVAGEYLPFDNSVVPLVPGAKAEYWLRGRIRTGPLSAEVLLNSYSATLTQRLFVGNHRQWRNLDVANNLASTFKNTASQQIALRLVQRLPLLADHTLEASAAVVNLSNLIYYNAQGQPAQDEKAGGRRLLIGFVRHRFRLGNVFFDNQGTYTVGAGADNSVLRVPALVAESRVYYQRRVFGRALFAQVGGEVYYQSRFQAYGYAPDTQQFYVQNDFTSGGYAVFNAFVAADIRTVSIFLKGAYLNQGIYRDGYFASPYFSGYPRRFQLGLRWRFYN